MFVVIEGAYDEYADWYVANVFVFTSAEEAHAFKPEDQSHSTHVYEAKNGDDVYVELTEKGYREGHRDGWYSCEDGW